MGGILFCQSGGVPIRRIPVVCYSRVVSIQRIPAFCQSRGVPIRRGPILPIQEGPNLEGSCFFANSEGSSLANLDESLNTDPEGFKKAFINAIVGIPISA